MYYYKTVFDLLWRCILHYGRTFVTHPNPTQIFVRVYGHQEHYTIIVYGVHAVSRFPSQNNCSSVIDTRKVEINIMYGKTTHIQYYIILYYVVYEKGIRIKSDRLKLIMLYNVLSPEIDVGGHVVITATVHCIHIIAAIVNIII